MSLSLINRRRVVMLTQREVNDAFMAWREDCFKFDLKITPDIVEQYLTTYCEISNKLMPNWNLKFVRLVMPDVDNGFDLTFEIEVYDGEKQSSFTTNYKMEITRG